MMASYLRVGVLCVAALLAAPVAQAQSLADAWKIIAGKEFVDLTHAFGPRSPVWSGFGQASMSPAADPKTREPYTIAMTDSALLLFHGRAVRHHIDLPAHFARRHHHGQFHRR
jgi:hypothetical protein